MEYLTYIAIGYYILITFKVIGQLIRVRFNLKEFYDERMSLILGIFAIVHILAVIATCGVYVVTGMVHAVL